MLNHIRTRFAPSPTGYLHVGGLRTALYAYLLARQSGGQFILRIEDTDQSRLVEGATKNIIETLRWAGIDFDEGPGKNGPYGPYIQSERLPLYKKHAEELVNSGHAYHCFCSSERLESIREAQIAHKLPPAYDKHCRRLTVQEQAARRAEQSTSVIRMAVPHDGEITFSDVIRGSVTFNYKAVDDQVLLKSDGFPTYHLAVVVDDHYMHITHVIRGEEWLSSTPKHILLYQYFGWTPPSFSHLPLLLNSDRSKLSKRQGDVAVEDYKNKGYLPESLINFIAFLGWNPGGTHEFFTMNELIKEFSLANVGKAGAVFNTEKLDWFNNQYIQKTPAGLLVSRVQQIMQAHNMPIQQDAFVAQVIEILKERVTVLPDFVTNGRYFFIAPIEFDPALVTKMWKSSSTTQLTDLMRILESLASQKAADIEEAFRSYAQDHNLSMGSIIQPLRLALSASSQGPSVYNIIELLGIKQAVARCRYAITFIHPVE